MRFKEMYSGWRQGRLSQEEAALVLGVVPEHFRPRSRCGQILKYNLLIPPDIYKLAAILQLLNIILRKKEFGG